MALKQCKECDNTVSNKAKTCPHCGARVKKSLWHIEIWKDSPTKTVHCSAIDGLPKDGWKNQSSPN